MADHRVKFDFVVHFTNGGSLSAQDFRLDIPSEGISDDQLAAYLIQDMRLLMAGRVDIANKQIIAEPHKRRAIDADDLPQRTIDLTADEMSLDAVLRLALDGPIRLISAEGESFMLARLAR